MEIRGAARNTTPSATDRRLREVQQQPDPLLVRSWSRPVRLCVAPSSWLQAAVGGSFASLASRGRPERRNPSVRARVSQHNSLNRCTNPPKRSESRRTRFSRCAAEQQRVETCLRLSSLAQHGHLEASRALGIRVGPRQSRASKATSRREPPAWCRAPAVHEECTSTVISRWVLRAVSYTHLTLPTILLV